MTGRNDKRVSPGRAVEDSGLDQVRAALAEVEARITRPDGSIRYDNTFVWVAAVR